MNSMQGIRGAPPRKVRRAGSKGRVYARFVAVQLAQWLLTALLLYASHYMLQPFVLVVGAPMTEAARIWWHVVN
jgi:hypothetical protein